MGIPQGWNRFQQQTTPDQFGQEDQPPGFFEALVGLIFEPGYMIRELLSFDDPPYSLLVFLMFLVTIFAPILSLVWRFELMGFDPGTIMALAVSIFFCLISFILLEGLLFTVLAYEFTFSQIVAAATYTLPPLTCALWLVLGFNYFTTGSLTIITYVLTGYVRPSDTFMNIIPYAASIVFLMMTLNFFYAVKAIGPKFVLNALTVTIFSIVPLAVSVLLGLYAGELTRDGFHKLLALLTIG